MNKNNVASITHPSKCNPDFFSKKGRFFSDHLIEAQVIGCCLKENDLITKLEASGGKALMDNVLHAMLVDEIIKRYADGRSISALSLAEFFENDPYFDELHEGKLVDSLKTLINEANINWFDDHVKELATKKGRRDLWSLSDDFRVELDLGADASALIDDVIKGAIDVTKQKKTEPMSAMKATTELMAEFSAIQKGEVKHVKSGIGPLDDIVSGFLPGHLILLGGRPSMGKTAVAVSLTTSIARSGKKVAFVSLEMEPSNIMARMVSEKTAQMGRGLAYSDIVMGNVPDNHLELLSDAARDVSELPIQFLPRKFSSLGKLEVGVRQAKSALGGLDMVVIDYAQLLQGNARSRYEEITEISISLKNMAMDLGVPVVALSQLSRSLESRDDKRPIMSDLRESGQLEQDADTVMFCYRPEYYLERMTPPEDLEALERFNQKKEQSRNKLEIIVAKQRQGRTGTAHVMCNVALNRIWESNYNF